MAGNNSGSRSGTGGSSQRQEKGGKARRDRSQEEGQVTNDRNSRDIGTSDEFGEMEDDDFSTGTY